MDDIKKNTLVYIGAQIKSIKESKGLSLMDLEAMTNIDNSNLGKYERGEKRMSVDILYRIAVALETPIDQFFPPLK